MLVNASPFVPVLVDEATDMSSRAALAIVLRISNPAKGAQEFFCKSLSDVSDN